jgi:peptide chain release factor 1
MMRIGRPFGNPGLINRGVASTTVLDRLSGLEAEYENVVMRLSDPAVQGDQKAMREAGKKLKDLEPLVEKYKEYRSTTEDLAVAKEMFNETDGADREAMRAEVSATEARIIEIEEELKVLLLPKDPNDDRNVIVEIRGAEGGDEANLFARDLYEMYARFADRMGWKRDVLSSDPSDKGGVNEISFSLRGEGAWSRMKHEGGGHRVQRVPVTESQGRIHTSSATVSVFPEAEEIDIEIHEKDLQIDVFRSGGSGGQSVNTTDSAVRMTHKPTGITVSMQDERSQIQNRAKAMIVLRSRVLAAEVERIEAETSATRKNQIGGGGRGEKIRTYNYKENRVTDHRIGLTIYKLDRVLQGELDEVSDACVADERARLLADSSSTTF